jgi:ribonuclease Z
MSFKITGYSTALFSTWYFVEELGILFDAGDGLTSGLLQKSRKIKHAFISHADRDHLAGLVQFNQLNARDGFPIIYYPGDSRSFPSMEEFTKKFDPQSQGTLWKPVRENSEVIVNESIIVKAIRNNHVQADAALAKSLSYKVYEVKNKLKREFAALPKDQIRLLMTGADRKNLTHEVEQI